MISIKLSSRSFLENASQKDLDDIFFDIQGRILDLFEMHNPTAFSVLDVLPDLGAFTRPKRA